MRKLFILTTLLVTIFSCLATDAAAEAMPTVKFTSGGELVVTDSSGLVHAFDAAGQPISVEGETAFGYFDRTLGGTMFDVHMLDGSWKRLDRDGAILYDKIREEWSDSCITACLIEAENRYQYLFFYNDQLVAQRVADKLDALHYLGVGSIYYECLPNRRTRLWDEASGKELILPFGVNPDIVNARFGLQTGQGVLTSSLSEGLTAFVDGELNTTILDKAIYAIEDAATGALYLLEYGDSGTILYDATYSKQLLSCECIISSVYNGIIITEETPQGYSLYTTDGKRIYDSSNT